MQQDPKICRSVSPFSGVRQHCELLGVLPCLRACLVYAWAVPGCLHSLLQQQTGRWRWKLALLEEAEWARGGCVGRSIPLKLESFPQKATKELGESWPFKESNDLL